MKSQLSNFIQALPEILEGNDLSVFSRTNIDFTEFSKIDRSKSEVHWLIRPEESEGVGAAIIHYHPGGESPPHLHTGFELAYILDGEMITDQGPVKKNDIMLLPPGSQHSSRSDKGCLAFIIWEKPPQPILKNEGVEK
ncbi:TPA: cupin domain-containing protein [Bacillus thuringiensis]|nr:cupin domain-containing protein [Bacillus thuringiensis]